MESKLERLATVLFKCKPLPLRRRIFCYRPAMVYLHPSANVSVRQYLLVNKNYDFPRIMRNKKAGSLYVGPGATLEVDAFSFNQGCEIAVNEGATLRLGTGYCSNDMVIDCFQEITIGRGCMISKGVKIRDSHNHDIVSDGNYVRTAPIHIGDHVWIGMGAMILSGVSIGSGSVVAAGAVVNRDVPENCLVGGVPAKVLKTDVVWQ